MYVSPPLKNWLALDMKFVHFISNGRPVNIKCSPDTEKNILSSFRKVKTVLCLISHSQHVKKEYFALQWSICLAYYLTLVICITRSNADVIRFLRKQRQDCPAVSLSKMQSSTSPISQSLCLCTVIFTTYFFLVKLLNNSAKCVVAQLCFLCVCFVVVFP